MNIIPVVIPDKVIYKSKIISLISLCIASSWGQILRILFWHVFGVVWEKGKSYNWYWQQ
jgi:hypothetical protein